jgi:hypothetical protein
MERLFLPFSKTGRRILHERRQSTITLKERINPIRGPLGSEFRVTKFLQDNPMLVQNLGKAYEQSPDRIHAALIPNMQAIAVRYENTILVMKTSLPCTRNAIEEIVGKRNYKKPGYMLIDTPSTIPLEQILEYEKRRLEGTRRRREPSTFTFGKHLDDPYGYIVADILGLLGVNNTRYISERHSIPLQSIRERS